MLGPHRLADDLVVRVFRPDAKEVEIVLPWDEEQSNSIPCSEYKTNGFFQGGTSPGKSATAIIAFGSHDGMGPTQVVRDPYSYGTIMGEMDLHLFAEGNHLQIYEKFGAHLRTIGSEPGFISRFGRRTRSASAWSGDFNGWDGRVQSDAPAARQRRMGIISARRRGGRSLQIRDPDAHGCCFVEERSVRVFQSARQIETSSMVYDLERYQWSDSEWMERAAEASGTTARSAFTKCISVHGGATPMKETALSVISNLLTRWCPTSWKWATRTSS